jgi:hypothetical protein
VKTRSLECPGRMPRFPWGMPRSKALTLALALPALLAAAPARAELIVFEDGRIVKAVGYRLFSEELEIALPGGGSYRVALSRVERIVDDEVVVEAVAVDDERLPSSGAYDLSYRPERKPLFGTAFDDLIAREARTHNIDASMV